MKNSLVCMVFILSKQDSISFMNIEGSMSTGIQGGIQLLTSPSSRKKSESFCFYVYLDINLLVS